MNPAYLLFSAIAFLLMKAKKAVTPAPQGLPPAASDDRDEPDHLLDSERGDFDFLRDEPDHLLDSERRDLVYTRDQDMDDGLVDDVWDGYGVESDGRARRAADYIHKQVIQAGLHPIVADAKALQEYDRAGGEAPHYIAVHQQLIGADETGVYDEQTAARIELLTTLASGSEEGLPEAKGGRALPSKSRPPEVIDANMFELKERDDWNLTPAQRKNHTEARKKAIKEYQKARSNGQSHEVGAAMWLAVYMKSGGYRKDTIRMMQRESGMPSIEQTSVWDENTRNWVRNITADYRRTLIAKKKK